MEILEKKSDDKQIDKERIVSWLQENIEISQENQLSLDEICLALKTKRGPAIGRNIQKVFPNVVMQRKRCKEDWTTKTVIYQGITWRTRVGTSEIIDFKDICHIAKDFFVMTETDNSITLGHILKSTINYNKVIIEICFQKDLQWVLSVCGRTEIKPDDFGMNKDWPYSTLKFMIVGVRMFYSLMRTYSISFHQIFKLEKNSILGILDGIRTIRLCHGVESEQEFSVDYKDNIIREIFTTLQEKASQNVMTVFRLSGCNRIINFRTHQSVNLCRVCKHALQNKKLNNSNHAHEDSTNLATPIDHSYIVSKKAKRPFADITNTCDKGTTSDHTYMNLCPKKTPKVNEAKKYKGLKTVCAADADMKTKSDTSCSHAKPSESSKCLTLTENDNDDMETIFNDVSKSCPPKIFEFLMSQKAALSSHPNGRRWNKNVIRLCLTLWCRSPKCYRDLRDSGFLVLPSQKILQIYKNKFHQKAGLNKELLHWMKNEAMQKNIPPEGYEGGLILDEMSIQSDLQFYSKNGKSYLIGFTEISEESKLMDEINTGKRETTLATHVLQYVFLGLTGFRFPLFYVPSKQATAADLCVLFWKIVNLLSIFGFKIRNISVDGAQTNRDFAKILLGNFNSATVSTMRIQNIYSLTTQNIYFIMDYSHVMKKIRNNLIKSGKQDTYKRHLYLNGNYIYWEHLKRAYMWDISNNPFPIHYKLSHEHFHLSSEAKMRNKLAEDVLNKDMLHLLKIYSERLSEKSRTELTSTIELIEHTSILIENFRDHRPITMVADIRLEQNKKVLQWFQNWEKSILSNTSLKVKEKHMISHQTRADICSLLIGFEELCIDKLKHNASSIVPNRLNSDVIENAFCQQRGLYNGNNTNPTYLNYCRTMNAVILGQATISRKSNAGGLAPGAAEPYSGSNYTKST